jgi:hypothetical protein
MRHHAGLAALIGATAILTASTASARDRALVIGVDRFPGIAATDADGKRLNVDLQGAVFDAKSFAALLTDVLRFDRQDVKVLLDGEATRERILAEFQTWLVEGTRPGDRAMFFYAGHGMKAAVTDPDGSTRFTSGIVPGDARGELHPNGDKDSVLEGQILGPEMARLLERLEGRAVTVIADACNSGSISRNADRFGPIQIIGRTLTPRFPIRMTAATVTDELARRNKAGPREVLIEPATLQKGYVAVWSAATVAQVTFDHPERPGGVFTQSFIDAVRHKKADHAGNGEITAAAVLNYIKGEAERICKLFGSQCRDGLTPDLLAADDYRLEVLAPVAPLPAAAAEPPAAGAPKPAFAPQALRPAPQPPKSAPPKDISVVAVQTLTHRNDFDVKAEILPGHRIKLGQEVAFRITAGEAGRLLVFDSGPDGKLTRIFPNSFSVSSNREGRIRARVPITIPDPGYGFAFRAQDKGPGTLLVIVAEEGADLDAVAADAGLAPISNAARAIEVIAATLQTPVITPDPDKPNRARRWAFAAVKYEVVP